MRSAVYRDAKKAINVLNAPELPYVTAIRLNERFLLRPSSVLWRLGGLAHGS